MLDVLKRMGEFLGGLFLEQKGKGKPVASLGRVAFWIVFGHAMHVFLSGESLSAEELSIFYALLGYQGVKVGKNAMTQTAAAWRGTSQSDSE